MLDALSTGQVCWTVADWMGHDPSADFMAPIQRGCGTSTRMQGGERSRMDLLESIGWVAAGFVPTFIALHLGYDTWIKRLREKIPAHKTPQYKIS